MRISACFLYLLYISACRMAFTGFRKLSLIRLVLAPLVVPAGQRVAAARHSLAAAGDADRNAVVVVGPGGGRGGGGGGGGGGDEGGVAAGAHRGGAA